MIWKVEVGVGRYQDATTTGARLIELSSVVQVMLVAETRQEAELVAAKIAAHDGIPLWTTTMYEW